MNVLLKRTLMIGLLLTAMMVMMVYTAAAAPPEPLPQPVYATGYVLVKLAADESAALPKNAEHLFDGWYRVPVVSGKDLSQTTVDLAGRSGVAGVYPDLIIQLPEEPAVAGGDLPEGVATAGAPNDPLFGRQWNMPQIGIPAAWDITTGRGAVVAVIDTGVTTGGPDGFCQPLHSEYNAITDLAGPGAANDGHSHGTHVAGTVADCAGNGTGVAGVAPGAQIMAVKVLADSGGGSYSDVARGINWAADNGADVINISLGSDCTSTWPTCSTDIVNDALANAAAADVIIVIAAGNGSSTMVGQPGNHPEAIAVAATDFAQALSYYSNRGTALGLAAPGGDPRVDLNGDGFTDGILQETRLGSTWGYYNKVGTSMAGPHVAGVAALLRACAPEADRDAVRDALENYALDLGATGFDTSYGHGFLQADASLRALAYSYGRDPDANCALTGEPMPCFTLSAAIAGAGSLTVDPPPNCDPDGGDGVENTTAENTAYDFGTQLTLTAAPDPGYQFTGWSGDASGATNPLRIRITDHQDVTATLVAPRVEPLVAVSLNTNGAAAGLAYTDEDVVLDDPAAGPALLFDGSSYGLGAADIDALAIMADGTLLVSTDSPAKNLPGLGSTIVDDSDIVRFDPATGQYSWYFDGSDAGLTTGGEDVDAVALLPDGRLLISTSGKVSVPGVTPAATAGDVLAFNGALGSDTTTGSWSLYVDGSDLSGGLGNIDGLAIDGVGGLYLSAAAAVTLDGQSMAPGDIFHCEQLDSGATTDCDDIDRFWQGTANGLAANANVDAVEVYLP